MKWAKLTEKKLNELKNESLFILVKDDDGHEYRYDVISFLKLDEGMGLSEEELKYHWGSHLHMGSFYIEQRGTGRKGSKYDYDDTDVLSIFSHFIIIGPK